MISDVEELAEKVEAAIDAQGLCVTMGGEPTFIPTDPEGAEWNLVAIGPEKLGYARRLTRRFLRELYPGGLVMQVFGKQYPEEPLPRWVMLTLFRNDGVPMWSHPERFLLDDAGGANPEVRALEVMGAIAEELGLGAHVLPCFEKGSSESPRGWVLPLDGAAEGWTSDTWSFTTRRPAVLLPGDSPIGLRLPLSELEEGRLGRALTVEVTDGAVHVFIPPLEYEHFAKLIAVLEEVVVRAEIFDLVICGYRPTETKGTSSLGLAADPGVLEVNLPPARCWRSHRDLLCKITEIAESEGLRTTRYHLNGQIQGTGGGSHLLFGGPSLEDNPFFQRPDLVASIIRYWQRHPALSYFFSGQYVGPGSQAPRADESQLSSIQELEIACQGVDSLERLPERDFLDRMFRNLMTDAGGNTHRAEICLDKLWNFDSPTGLQGLVELRAFETMPDATQQALGALFVRAIVSMLATTPCRAPLVRFGARLHDAYLLPSLLWHDLAQICEDLSAAGLPFKREWLVPIFDFRFPVLGRLRLDEGSLYVRQGLDPWPLMAEGSAGGATARMVDNSTDRVEISLRPRDALGGAIVTVNGVALELREVGDNRVAGVRYKSADGWPALHPHIPVQSPLEIEVLDRSNRVVAGARYHFWNPDAPRYKGRPRDPSEAQARRKARWIEVHENLAVARNPRPPIHADEDHYTLDLRRGHAPGGACLSLGVAVDDANGGGG